MSGSFALSLCFTAIARNLAQKTGFVSKPSADRYNLKTVPLGGGAAILATILLTLLSGILVVKFLLAPGRINLPYDSVNIHIAGFLSRIPQILIVLACAVVLFLAGLWDDKNKLGPFTKLTIEFVVAIIAAVFADIRIEFFIHNKIVTSVITAFWIVLIINAFNFMDNMDGAAAGIAVIISFVLFIAAALSQQVFISAMAIILAGTLLGFLVFNFPPARIFAGDAGSFIIGFFIALLTLRTTYYHQTGNGQWYPVLLPLIAMAVPLYDFLSVIFLRISQGKSPLAGDTQHFSHRLKNCGLTDTQTVLTLYLATLCTSLGAIFLYQVNLTGAILIFFQTIMILAIIAILETTSNNGKHKSA
jgi:UDP-GlcNAc:undecaprenyl-phosphate GlcNAc-1-phosphate transferase